VELRAEPVDVIVSKLVNSDKNDERRGGDRSAICFGCGLGAELRPAQYAKEK
jgi:hypothetical protein